MPLMRRTRGGERGSPEGSAAPLLMRRHLQARFHFLRRGNPRGGPCKIPGGRGPHGRDARGRLHRGGLPCRARPADGLSRGGKYHRDKPRAFRVHRLHHGHPHPAEGRRGFRTSGGGIARMKTYDLRSDTVTRPGPGMRKAMADADVGDDVYGEDPSVNRLQEMAAEMTGKEAALFVPSGSMGNLIPIYLNCGSGNELLIDSHGHSVQHELAGVSALAGSLPIMVTAEKGILTPALLEPWVQPDLYDHARTRVVVIENTHNAAGGTFYTQDALKKISGFARGRRLSVHMDGARLFNAV